MMKRNFGWTRFGWTIVLGIACASLAGCSKDKSSQAATEPVSGTPAETNVAEVNPDAQQRDACSFLTAEQISTQVGKPFAEGRKTNESGGGKKQSRMTTCTWDVAAAEGDQASPAGVMSSSGAVTLIHWTWVTAGRGPSFLESFRKVAKETNSPAPLVLSIGDGAIAEGGSVHAYKGNQGISLTVQMFSDGDREIAPDQARELAEEVVGKL